MEPHVLFSTLLYVLFVASSIESLIIVGVLYLGPILFYTFDNRLVICDLFFFIDVVYAILFFYLLPTCQC